MTNTKQFLQTYTLKKGIQTLGEKGKEASYNETRQLHDQTVFEPIQVDELTTLKQRCAMESLLFLVEKCDRTVKTRICANGSMQREYMPKEETASPTVMLESILITGTIEAEEKCNIITTSIPNAFVQTGIPEQDGMKIIMKIHGVLVDMLVEIDQE